MNIPKFTADIYAWEKVATGAGNVGNPTAAKIKATDRPACNSLVITVDAGGSIRWTADGTAPTAANGHEAVGPVGFGLEGAGNCSRFQWFAVGASVVQLSFGHV